MDRYAARRRLSRTRRPDRRAGRRVARSAGAVDRGGGAFGVRRHAAGRGGVPGWPANAGAGDGLFRPGRFGAREFTGGWHRGRGDCGGSARRRAIVHWQAGGRADWRSGGERTGHRGRMVRGHGCGRLPLGWERRMAGSAGGAARGAGRSQRYGAWVQRRRALGGLLRRGAGHFERRLLPCPARRGRCAVLRQSDRGRFVGAADGGGDGERPGAVRRGWTAAPGFGASGWTDVGPRDGRRVPGYGDGGGHAGGAVVRRCGRRAEPLCFSRSGEQPRLCGGRFGSGGYRGNVGRRFRSGR